MQKNNPQLFPLYKFRIRTKECFKVLSKIFISLSSPQLSLNQTQQKTEQKPPLQQKIETNSLPRRKWITIVHRERALELPQQFICAYTKHRGNKKNYDSILCVSLNEIMTSTVGERGNLFHHDVAGLPSPCTTRCFVIYGPGNVKTREILFSG